MECDYLTGNATTRRTVSFFNGDPSMISSISHQIEWAYMTRFMKLAPQADRKKGEQGDLELGVCFGYAVINYNKVSTLVVAIPKTCSKDESLTTHCSHYTVFILIETRSTADGHAFLQLGEKVLELHCFCFDLLDDVGFESNLYMILVKQT